MQVLTPSQDPPSAWHEVLPSRIIEEPLLESGAGVTPLEANTWGASGIKAEKPKNAKNNRTTRITIDLFLPILGQPLDFNDLPVFENL